MSCVATAVPHNLGDTDKKTILIGVVQTIAIAVHVGGSVAQVFRIKTSGGQRRVGIIVAGTFFETTGATVKFTRIDRVAKVASKRQTAARHDL